jgi:predicted enzyme related to lactoylglutathione lyase
LLTAEPDEAFGFYKAHFGWHSLRKCPLGPMFGEVLEWSASELPGEADGGIFDLRAPGFARGVPHWLFAFEVADVEHSLARARALGADLASGPHPLPCGYQLAVLHDPQGAVFGVASRR